MEKRKKGSTGLVDAVKSGEFLDNLKRGLEQLKGGNQQVLPEVLKKKMVELDAQATAFVEAQKHAEEEAMKLKRLTAALCSDAIAMYTPPVEAKKKATSAASSDAKASPSPEKAAEKSDEESKSKGDKESGKDKG